MHTLRFSLICWVLAVVIGAGCKTAQPDLSNVTIPNQDFCYSFNEPPFISPRIIRDLSCWISDQGDQVVAINLDSQNSNRYSGEPQVSRVEEENTCVYWKEVTVKDGTTNESEFSYQYVCKTSSGIYVLLTSDWGGGSGVFMNLLLVEFEYDNSTLAIGNRALFDLARIGCLSRRWGRFL